MAFAPGDQLAQDRKKIVAAPLEPIEPLRQDVRRDPLRRRQEIAEPVFVVEQQVVSAGERELFAIPRLGVMRTMGLNHWYHHRGEVVVYLRLLRVPVQSGNALR